MSTDFRKESLCGKRPQPTPRTHAHTVALLLCCILLSTLFAQGLFGCAPAEEDSYVGEDGKTYYTGVADVEGFEHVSPETALALIESGNVTVVDVRGTISYEHEHIPGAIDFMYDADFAANAPSVLLDKNATIVVYCDYGGVSKLAAEDLVAAGYTNIVEFNGMEVWPGETVSGSDPGSFQAASERIPVWAGWLMALVIGILFGFAIKRSRFCMTGLVRDIFLRKRWYNIVLLVAIISIVGLFYFSMGRAGVIHLSRYLPPFSLLTVALGGLMFGFGAAMANGCLVSTLVKAGDGRVIGLTSLAVFIVCGCIASMWPGNIVTEALRSVAVVHDNLIGRTSSMPVLAFAVAAIICIVLIAFRIMNETHYVTPGARYRLQGLRHVLFEAHWPRELMAAVVALLLVVIFLASDLAGRHYGFAASTPTLSWVYSLFNPAEVVGASNPFDLRVGWATFLVLGIVLGSLLTALAGGTLSLAKPSRRTLVRAIIGSALMGFGAVFAQGDLISNGLVGTAQLSIKSWYALLFMVIGMLIATQVFFRRRD